jgi:hypothetical protein
MPTRFYTSNTSVLDFVATPSTEWDNTTGFDRVPISTTRLSTAMSTKTVFDATATQNRDILARQLVSAPLAAQTISGTVKGRIRVAEGGSTQNLRAQCIIRVMSSDGLTVRGTLYAGDVTTGFGNPTSEFAVTTLTNRQMPRGASQALTNVITQLNDRIVVEIGYRKHAAVSTSATINFGDDSATDLAENETETTANNPWIEFSGTILFPPVHPLVGTSAGVGDQTGALRFLYPIAGTTTGVGSQTGALTMTPSARLSFVEFEVPDGGSISGTTSGLGDQTGALHFIGSISGTSAGIGDQTGILQILPVAFLSFVEFELPNAAATTQALAGTSPGIGNQTGAVSIAWSVAATSAGIGNQTGTLQETFSLAGSAGGVGNQTGAIGVHIQLGTVADGTGEADGDLVLRWSLAGSSDGIGNASGILAETGVIFLAGTSDGVGNQTGTLREGIPLGGTSDGIGEATGSILLLITLAGTTGGIGGATGSLEPPPPAGFTFAAQGRITILVIEGRGATLVADPATRRG